MRETGSFIKSTNKVLRLRGGTRNMERDTALNCRQTSGTVLLLLCKKNFNMASGISPVDFIQTEQLLPRVVTVRNVSPKYAPPPSQHNWCSGWLVSVQISKTEHI